jgi:hypothetical protein
VNSGRSCTIACEHRCYIFIAGQLALAHLLKAAADRGSFLIIETIDAEVPLFDFGEGTKQLLLRLCWPRCYTLQENIETLFRHEWSIPTFRYLEERRLLAPPFQHPGDAQILIEVGPMNAHWHDLEVGTLLRRSPLQPWVPIQRGRDLAAIREGDDKLGRGELDPLRAEIASVNLHDVYPKKLPPFT